jgi:hypothetical protein
VALVDALGRLDQVQQLVGHQPGALRRGLLEPLLGNGVGVEQLVLFNGLVEDRARRFQQFVYRGVRQRLERLPALVARALSGGDLPSERVALGELELAEPLDELLVYLA